ncbi:MAG: TetR/AcrR family transcriptional regulator [Stenotrophobium sp.]
MDERRSERRQSLIEAGVEVYGSEGYHNATVRGICAEAGLTERYFYESFENSEALLGAVYENLIEQLNRRMLAAIDTAHKQPEAMALAALRVYFEYNRDPRVARILFAEVLGVSPRVDQLYRSAMQRFAALIGSLGKGVLGNAAAPGIDEELIASGLVGAAVQIAMNWTLGGYKKPIEEIVASTHAIYVAVVRQQQAGAISPARAR